MPVTTITLEGLVPSKKNSRINLPSGISVPSARYKQWEAYARDVAALYWKGEPTTKPVTLHLDVYGLRNDLDNILSSVMDALQVKKNKDGMEGWGIYFSDRQVWLAVVQRMNGKDKKCVVRIGVSDG